ncbi:hypothetical protein [Paenibacillus jilunlii]|nr:hypothetical protein [Paenibacillus jilunlii]
MIRTINKKTENGVTLQPDEENMAYIRSFADSVVLLEDSDLR